MLVSQKELQTSTSRGGQCTQQLAAAHPIRQFCQCLDADGTTQSNEPACVQAHPEKCTSLQSGLVAISSKLYLSSKYFRCSVHKPAQKPVHFGWKFHKRGPHFCCSSHKSGPWWSSLIEISTKVDSTCVAVSTKVDRDDPVYTKVWYLGTLIPWSSWYLISSQCQNNKCIVVITKDGFHVHMQWTTLVHMYSTFPTTLNKTRHV